jgi:hypothetical protein
VHAVPAGQFEELERIKSILEAPPPLTAAQLDTILSTCPKPIPGDTIDLARSEGLDAVGSQVSRMEGARISIRIALAEMIIGRAFEGVRPSGELLNRLKVIEESSRRLDRALGGTKPDDDSALSPVVGKYLVQAVMRIDDAPDSPEQELQPAGNPRYARLKSDIRRLEGAVRSAHDISRWAQVARRIAKRRRTRGKRYRDRPFESLIQALGKVWTQILGQDLEGVNARKRNATKWAPLPDSVVAFTAFVQECVTALGIRHPVHHVRAAVEAVFRKEDVGDDFAEGAPEQAVRPTFGADAAS